MRARKFTDMCISCLNNALLRDWLDLQNSCIFRYLKSSFVGCVNSVLETLLRCLWDAFSRCLINGFVRYCLDLQKSCLLDILKTSPQRQLLNILQMCFVPLDSHVRWPWRWLHLVLSFYVSRGIGGSKKLNFPFPRVGQIFLSCVEEAASVASLKMF